LTLALCWLGFVAAASAQTYATPEDAVTAYIEGVAARDFRAVWATTAVNEMAKGFDFVNMVDRLGSLAPTLPAPASDPFYVALNRETIGAQIARQIQFFVYGLLTTSELLEMRVVRMDGAGAEAFAADVDLGALGGLTLLRVGLSHPEMFNSEIHQRNLTRQAANYGADEISEQVALIELGGRTFMTGFIVMRFGETWKIQSQVAHLAGTQVSGVPMPITPEEFALHLQ
jgi:hypothetical protein